MSIHSIQKKSKKNFMKVLRQIINKNKIRSTKFNKFNKLNKLNTRKNRHRKIPR